MMGDGFKVKFKLTLPELLLISFLFFSFFFFFLGHENLERKCHQFRYNSSTVFFDKNPTITLSMAMSVGANLYSGLDVFLVIIWSIKLNSISQL